MTTQSLGEPGPQPASQIPVGTTLGGAIRVETAPPVFESPDDRIQPSKQTPDVDEDHRVNLLEQFYLTLRVTYLSTPEPRGSAIHSVIERLFNDKHAWRNAYEIEQLLCFVMSDQQIETELNRRMAEAQALKLDYVAVIDRELHPDNGTPGDKRIVLHRLLNDLQWFYSKRVQHQASGKRLMVRVSALFTTALATFFLVLYIQFFAHPLGEASGSSAPTADATKGTSTQGSTSTGAGSGGTAGAGSNATGGANTSSSTDATKQGGARVE